MSRSGISSPDEFLVLDFIFLKLSGRLHHITWYLTVVLKHTLAYDDDGGSDDFT